MTKRYHRYILALVVSLITIAIFLPVLRNDFINLDDDSGVYNNVHIRALNWKFFQWAFTDIYYFVYWKPVVSISYAVDYALWGLNPAGYHLTSILLHAANTFFVVCVVIMLFDAWNRFKQSPVLSLSPDERTALITAGVAGILFGLHPMRVEAVAWIDARSDPLYALFFLMSLLAYIQYIFAVEKVADQTRPRAYFLNGWYVLSFILFIFAVGSKPMAVTLPVILLIIDWYPCRRMRSWKSFVDALEEKIPFASLSLIMSITTYMVEKSTGEIKALDIVPVAARVLLAVKATMIYLWKTVTPVSGITLLQPRPENVSFLYFENVSAIVLALVISILCILMIKRQRIFMAVWTYHVVTLLPVIGIVSVTEIFVADRYTYLSSLGPLFLAGLGSALTWGKIDSLIKLRFAARCLAAALAISAVLGLGYVTTQKIGIWKNSIILWSHAIEKDPYRVPYYYMNRGVAYRMEGRLEHSLEDYTRAITLSPDLAIAYIGRGNVFREMGQLERSRDDYSTAIALSPSPTAYTNRGIMFGESKQYDQALSDFNAAIALNSTYADAYVGRGLLFIETGHHSQAAADLTRAVELNPYSEDAYLNRGVAFEHLGDLVRAKEDYDKALELKPSDNLAYENRAIVFSKMGMIDKAIDDCSRAIALKPDNARAYMARGDLYRQTGNAQRAAFDYRKVCDLGNKEGCEALRAYAGHKEQKWGAQGKEK